MSKTVRRVVTGHDPDGRAIFQKVDDLPVTPSPAAPGLEGAVIWTTGAVPADNVDDAEGEHRSQGAGLKAGSVLWVTEFAPGFESPLHRTFSIDYGVVVSGLLELELEGGECVRLGPGDLIVQRGTNHLWRNPSPDQPCRIVMSMIEARPVQLNGRTLPDTLN